MGNTIEIIISATDNASKKMSGLVDTLKSIGALAIAKQVGEIAFNLAKIGAQSEAAEARFRAFAGGAEQAADIMQRLEEVTGGAISRIEGMQAATKLLSMGLAKNADEVAALTNIAVRLGDQTMSAGERVNDFALLLANQSVMRLDNFGISSGKVRERIQELQEATPGLTREMAFLQATMEIGSQSLQKLEGVGGGTVVAMNTLDAAFKDLAATAGKYLSPALGEIATGLIYVARQVDNTLGFGRKLTELLKQNTSDALEAGKGWEDYARKQLEAQVKALQSGKMMDVLRASMGKTEKDLAMLRVAEKNHAYMVDLMIERGLGYGETLDKITYQTLRNIDATNQLAEASNDVGVAMRDMQAQTAQVYDGMSGYDRAMIQAAEHTAENTQAAEKLRQELSQQNLARATENWNMVREAMSGALGDETATYIQNIEGVRARMDEIRGTVYNLRVEQDKLPEGAQRYIDITKEVSGLESEYDGLLSKLGELSAAHEEANKQVVFNMLEQRLSLNGLTGDEQDALTQLAFDWGMVDEATLKALQGVADVAKKMGEGAIKADGLGAALKPLVSLGDETAGALDTTAGAADSASVSMSAAAQAARDLRARLDELESKTVTIDVVYNDQGLPSATVTAPGGQQNEYEAMASGFEGVFTRPTRALFGESGPEYVKAVPLGQQTTNNVSNGGDTIYINNGAQAMMVMAQKARMRSLAGAF